MNIAKNIKIRLSSIYGLRTLSTLKLVRKQSGISLQNSAGFAISLPNKCTCCKHRIVARQLSSVPEATIENTWSESSDKETENIIAKHFKLIQNFISEEEENKLLKEAEKHLKRARYEYDHWDNAIHGYRETEKSRWNDDNKAVLQRVRDAAFEPGVTQLTLVHVLDLAKDGYIKPHVDSVKFCGSTITGLSLLSSSVMRLANEQNPKQWINILLEPRSLYIMTGQARYDYTHEILKNEESIFRGKVIPRDRRISIMCRNEP